MELQYFSSFLTFLCVKSFKTDLNDLAATFCASQLKSLDCDSSDFSSNCLPKSVIKKIFQVAPGSRLSVPEFLFGHLRGDMYMVKLYCCETTMSNDKIGFPENKS